MSLKKKTSVDAKICALKQSIVANDPDILDKVMKAVDKKDEAGVIDILISVGIDPDNAAKIAHAAIHGIVSNPLTW